MWPLFNSKLDTLFSEGHERDQSRRGGSTGQPTRPTSTTDTNPQGWYTTSSRPKGHCVNLHAVGPYKSNEGGGGHFVCEFLGMATKIGV